MKYCLNCGRNLFDDDKECDKCHNTNFIKDFEFEKIKLELSECSNFKRKQLLKNVIYKSIYDNIINKPKELYNCSTHQVTNESNEEYFERINKHTIQQPTRQPNTPHCPTCGSTNIQKISDTKRWLTTGLFGLASSDVGKTMVCKKCGYKW